MAPLGRLAPKFGLGTEGGRPPPDRKRVLRPGFHGLCSIFGERDLPSAVIAEQLGHADTRMTEKHYAHLSGGYVAETIRAHFPKLGIGSDTSVVPLSPASRRGT